MNRKNKEFVIILTIVSFVVCFVLAAVILSFRIASTASKPHILISNMHPCIDQDEILVPVKSFKTNDVKYICADMETDRPPAELTLIVEPPNDLSVAFIYDAVFHFDKGSVSFLIKDELPPGRYRARILYARDILEYIYIDVDGE